MNRKICLLALLASVLAPALSASAHKPSDSYLTLVPGADRAIAGHWDIALRDLDAELALDADGDGALTWRELSLRESDVSAHAAAHLTLLSGDVPCALSLGAEPLGLISHSDGAYARLPLRATCAADGPLSVRYKLFFERDAQHRAVVRWGAGAAETTAVIDASNSTLALSAQSAPAPGALVRSGVVHILSGLDHVLFLLALLLPVLRQRARDGGTRPLRTVLGEVTALVTAFTVAHSLTLGLAALGVLRMSASIIEPAIAASVALAAIDNLWPLFGGTRWSIAFALGLLHGFGFASVLTDLGLRGGALLRALLAFNVGVELGQLALVLAFVPIGLLLCSRRVARLVLVRGGSASIAVLSLVWLVERVSGE